MSNRCATDTVYGIGLIGAVVYFFTTAPTWGEKLFGLLKAIVWPAILVFELLKYLQV